MVEPLSSVTMTMTAVAQSVKHPYGLNFVRCPFKP